MKCYNLCCSRTELRVKYSNSPYFTAKKSISTTVVYVALTKDRTLSIIQQKTGQMLHVPIPVETGWAIINYMKYGRPTSDDDHLFVRHSPEGGAFSSRNKLQDTLHKYMRKANIEYPPKEHRGLHSLRSGYAKTLLKKGTPLPVISDLLGHTSTLATSHYLRIDMANLKQCAIDVEEVLQNG